MLPFILVSTQTLRFLKSMLIHCHLTITKVYGLRMCADLSVQHRETFWNARGFLKISLTGFRSVCFVFSYIDYSLPVHWLINYQQIFSSYVTCFGDWNTWMRLCKNTAFALRMCNDECNNTNSGNRGWKEKSACLWLHFTTCTVFSVLCIYT